ncbi:hypothetical protein R3P38DRAFT_165518 [Favolaschia claudopus]|uniref:Transmembrane protein n=1 Tax=Favolaschia claudopus TaxID=2862362 RepID=A0AAW0CWD5_9AGAR
MAPTPATPISVLPPVGNYPYFPTNSSFATPTSNPFYSSTSFSSAVIDALLIISIIVAFVGISSTIYCCTRNRNRNRAQRAQNAAAKPNSESEDHYASGQKSAADDDEVFPVKHMDLAAPESTTNEILLPELPKVWRFVGRPNAAMDAPDPGFEESPWKTEKSQTPS